MAQVQRRQNQNQNIENNQAQRVVEQGETITYAIGNQLLNALIFSVLKLPTHAIALMFKVFLNLIIIFISSKRNKTKKYMNNTYGKKENRKNSTETISGIINAAQNVNKLNKIVLYQKRINGLKNKEMAINKVRNATIKTIDDIKFAFLEELSNYSDLTIFVIILGMLATSYIMISAYVRQDCKPTRLGYLVNYVTNYGPLSKAPGYMFGDNHRCRLSKEKWLMPQRFIYACTVFFGWKPVSYMLRPFTTRYPGFQQFIRQQLGDRPALNAPAQAAAAPVARRGNAQRR